MSDTKDFFDQQTEHSKVKTEIVVDYFAAWAGIMKRKRQKLTYLDLCSGPGRYKDGTESTPLLILSKAMEQPGLSEKLHVAYYEKTRAYFDELKKSVENHPASRWLAHRPIVERKEVNPALINELPIDDCTFCFIDPFGYKGVSLRLLVSVLKNWGSDCVFYLSVSGIRRNVKVRSQTDALTDLFGCDGLEVLREHVKHRISRPPFGKLVVERLQMALKRHNKPRTMYFLPFAVEHDRRNMISHYLIFLTKHPKGFEIMKFIMAKRSYKDQNDIPLYLFTNVPQLEFEFAGKMDNLLRSLTRDFTGQVINVRKLVDLCHRKGYMYTTENIKSALDVLEVRSLLSVDVPRQKRPKNKDGKITMGDKRTVTFL